MSMTSLLAAAAVAVMGPLVAVLGDAGCLDYARIRFASGDRPGTVRDFAGTVPRKVRLFRDADPSDTKPCAPIVRETCVTDKLVVPCAANGGFAAIVE